jgi:peptidoglycan/xylan/chitin deacetylase (PgdA/CDA1 family)
MASGGRNFYAEHLAVIPYGRKTLELPILMYHYIRVPPLKRIDPVGYNLSVAPSVFAAQMDWLAAHGYHPVTFEDVRLYWQRVTPLPSRPVIITLDDGYQDLYTTAFPILTAHGFTAVAYIVTGFVGERGYVTQEEIREMDHAGIEIGAHTVNHADLARAPQPWLTYQVSESKSWLEKLVGHHVLDMAYPSGKYNAAAILAVERTGYYSAVTEQVSLLHTQADRYAWGRVRVAGGETLALFIAGLGPIMPSVTIARVLPDSTPAALQQRT